MHWGTWPFIVPNMKTPKAVMAILHHDSFPGGYAKVCAWCDDKKQAEEWAAERGLQVTHGLCSLHLKKQLDEIAKETTAQANASN